MFVMLVILYLSIDLHMIKFERAMNKDFAGADCALDKFGKFKNINNTLSIHHMYSEAALDQLKCYQPHFPEFNFLEMSALGCKLIITPQYIYFGQVENSQKHGKGILLSQNGKKFEGNYFNDHKEGFGWEYFSNGSYYEGYYELGKPHGFGKFTWANGEFYEGEWYKGVKEGKGRWQGVNGDSYDGDWKNGKASGFGEHIWTNGDRYVGCFQDCLKNGEGVEYFSNGDVYNGNYKNGKPNGYGEYSWSNGAIFKGYFEDGLRSGKGIWRRRIEDPTDVFQGEYQDDKKNGHGIYRWANGNYYVGSFMDDYKHGYGEMFYSDGSAVRGRWEQGKLISELIQPEEPEARVGFKLGSRHSQQISSNSNPSTAQTIRANKTIRIRQYSKLNQTMDRKDEIVKEKKEEKKNWNSKVQLMQTFTHSSQSRGTRPQVPKSSLNQSYYLNIRRPRVKSHFF